MEGKKPLIGVKIFGVGLILIGLLVSVAPLSEFMIAYSLNMYIVLVLSAAILFIIAGSGMLTLKNWARVLFLCLLGLNMLFGVRGIYIGAPLAVAPGAEGVYVPTFLLLSLLPFATAMLYFIRPKVRRQFQDQT